VDRKQTLRRFVDEVVNGGRDEVIDELYFLTFDGDRISTVRGIEDTLDRFRQLGLNPTAG
jgi:hypothetical protein